MRRMLVVGLAVLAGCATTPPPAPAGPARRVVSLAPSVTEIVYALGAGDRLIGVCGQCDHPAAARALPRVGGYLAPSVEAVLAGQPDLVIAVPSPGNREAVRSIERAGLRVLVVGDRRLADVWAAIRDVAAALGLEDEGRRLEAQVRAGLDAVQARVAGRPVRRVLVIVDRNPLMAVGGGTLQDELVTLAGGTNVAADAGTVWPKITLELVVERAPEVIIDGAMGTEDTGAAVFAGLTTVPAVADGRIVALHDPAFLRAGPRVAEAAATLAAAIHPEAFAREAGRS